MTMNQVFDVLGKPYSISGLRGVHDMGCRNPNPGLNLDINEGSDIRKLVNDFISNQKFCCDGNKRDLEEFNFITLVYTRRGFLVSYPMLWVHLDQSYKVDNIFAKEYEGGPLGNDPGIYFFGFAMDSAYITRDYTKTYRWMNKEKFYRCFQ